MRILMLLERDFPPDERVEKEIASLIKQGFFIDIATYTFSNKAPVEKHNGYTIYRRDISKFYYKLSAAALILPFYFNFWRKFIAELFKSTRYDVIHVHDLPLSKVAYEFKRKYGVKLIFDQHEFYSNWIIHTAHYNKGIGKVVKQFSNWARYEQKYLNKADLVITVEEPLRQSYLSERGINPDKIITVPNTPSSGVFNLDNINSAVADKYKNDFVIFYAGGIDVLRGLDLIIRSLPAISIKISNVKFVIAGKVSGGFNPLELAKKYGVEHYIEMVGWLTLSEMASYIVASKVCIFTPPANRDEINKTIATKIYQYIALGKPVIVSSAKMMREFVENNKIGLAVEDVDSVGFSEAIFKLAFDDELYHTLSENCLKTAESYQWEKTSEILVDKYKLLEKS